MGTLLGWTLVREVIPKVVNVIKRLIIPNQGK